MGIDYEEKAFYDILKAVSKKYEFEYPDDKMIELSKRIKTIVDDKSRYTDWSTREDIKANLQVDLILLLDEFDYAKAKLEAQSELQYEDLSDYEIPPRTQFSMLKKPAVSINRYHREQYALDEKSKELLRKLYSLIDLIEPCGDDDKHILWLREERGTIEDYGNLDELIEDGIVDNKEQFEECWAEEYPDEYCWYRLTTLKYNDYYTVFLNGTTVIQESPDNQGWEHDISEYLEWLIEKTQEVITLLKKGEYMVWLNENLPYKYRLGSVSMKDYWALYPEEKADHYENISQDECEEFARYMQSEGVLEARIKDMTVNTYLDFCKTGYIANNLKGSTEASAFELYKRYADDRDGGLLTIDPDSAAAFNEWYALSHEEKWKLENPTHMWEAIKGSSRTRVHLSVQRDEKGYYLYVSANEYCCPEYGVRLYNALKRENVPITFYNGGTISKYLNGEGKVGIVPCFDSPSDYFYGGFADKDVGEFINLPDEKYNDLIHKAQWEPLVEVRLKGKDM